MLRYLPLSVVNI